MKSLCMMQGLFLCNSMDDLERYVASLAAKNLQPN